MIISLSSLFANAQFEWEFRIADSSYNNIGYFTHTDLISYRDSINASPFNSWWMFKVNRVYFKKNGVNTNDGKISGNMFWTKTTNGMVLSSPIDSLPVKYNQLTNFPATSSDYIRGNGTTAAFPTIPTNTNQLTNGSNFITASSSDALTNKTGNISQWTNNSGFITSSYTGFDSRYPVLSGSYSNPSWITALPLSKITFSGSASQYIAGDGSIITFPTVPTNTNQLTNGAGYITTNQTITLTGDATGSGTTAISVTLPTTGVTAGTYEFITVNSKGLVTGAYNLVSNDITTRTSGTAYQASSTTRTYDLDFTVSITAVSTLLNGADGQVTLETSANGTTGWAEYTRSQTTVSGVLSTTSGTQQLIALNIPAGTYYRLVFTKNSATAGSATWSYLKGHETLRK